MGEMSKARVSEATAYFKSDIKSVWDVITNNEDYTWRSDIKKIETTAGGTQWKEYYNEKKYTKFTLIEKVKYIRYIFKMENDMFTGHFTGHFYHNDKAGTKVIFTENVFIKNPIIRIISHLFWNLEKIQQTYIRDLKIKLQEEDNAILEIGKRREK
jgi:hypothetical protein